MYNGIGLKTPRGSGTNGYVTRNLSFVQRPNNNLNGSNRSPQDAFQSKPVNRKPSRDVLLHKEKRKVEIQLLNFREELEESGVEPEKVESLVSEERERQYKHIEELLDRDLKMEKEKEMDRLGLAFQISRNYKEGDAFLCFKKPNKDDVEQFKQLK